MKNSYSYTVITPTSCKNDRVVLRADLNVPISDGTIDDDFRLQELLPTLDLLLSQQATIVLITHIGRPHQDHEPIYSTQLLVDWLTNHGYRVFFAPTLAVAHEQSHMNPHTIIVLENIRLFPGEMSHDRAFAKELAELGDCYVNDAFGTLHRTDSSISLTPTFFAPDKRFIGLLIKKELALLEPLLQPQAPFVMVLGGGKITDKLPLIEKYIGTADTLLLCPAIAFTFMQAHGLPIGNSLVDTSLLTSCKKILEHAATTKTRILLPTDLQVAAGSYDGPLSHSLVSSLKPHDIGIALGPVSTAAYCAEIGQAKTIFFNAAMGFTNRPETLVSAKELLKAINRSDAYSVIGGGDSVALARTCIPENRWRHLSTGGGATLTYLSGQTLPGLAALSSI